MNTYDESFQEPINMKSLEDITGTALLLEGIGFSHKLEKRRIGKKGKNNN